MNALGTGETIRDGQPVPENEVERGGPAVMSFQAQAAETTKLGSRSRGKAAPSEPGQTFQARPAETVIVRPPHWENLAEVLPEAIPPIETEPQAPSEASREPESETPALSLNAVGEEAGPAIEGAEAEKEKES
ncbi:MAG: hypothetical protein ACYC6G_20330 [Desulfobaccales bacterium]